MSHRSLRDITNDLRWGFSQAFYFTLLFGGLGVIARLAIGDTYVPGLSLLQLIVALVLIGIWSGVLIGILRPLTRGLVGSGVVGGLWGICLTLFIVLPMGGWGNWIPFIALTVLDCVGCAVIGVQIRRTSTRIEVKRRSGLL